MKLPPLHAVTILHYVVAYTVVALVLGSPSISDADDPAQSQLARTLYEEGLDLAGQERWHEAIDRFERAFAIRAEPAIALNLASALMAENRLIEASEWLGQAAIRSQSHAVRDLAISLRTDIARRIGHIVIVLPGDQTGWSVTLDGKDVTRTLGTRDLAVDPGEHIVALLRNGVLIRSTTIEIPPGSFRRIVLDRNTDRNVSLLSVPR